MRTASTMLLSALLFVSAANAKEASFPKFNIDFTKLIPAQWKVGSLDTQAKPYGWEGDDSGIAITVSGPTKVQGLKGEDAVESLTIYVMPKDAAITEIGGGRTPHRPARFLGSDEHVSIYAMLWTRTITWDKWGTDICACFGIDAPKH